MPGPQVTPFPEQSWPKQPRAVTDRITLANAIDLERFTDPKDQPSKVMLLTLAVTVNVGELPCLCMYQYVLKALFS